VKGYGVVVDAMVAMMKSTRYFSEQVLRKRPYIKIEV
jgi:hypothetical protein